MKKPLSFLVMISIFGACQATPAKPLAKKKSSPAVEQSIPASKIEPEQYVLEEKSVLPQEQKIETPKVLVKKTKVQKTTPILVKDELITNEPVLPPIEVLEENSTKVEAPIQMVKMDFSKVYGQLLSLYVSKDGKVDYPGLVKAKELMNQAIQHFKDNQPESNWSDNQKLAYWINAYNLFTLKLVCDNYPVKSIRDIAGGKPWDKAFIPLEGKTLSLNDIENNIIRKRFNEPRIHFAVNCASVSCPKLLNKPYTKDNLSTLLTEQTKAYLADKNENILGSKAIEISNIFNWYKEDFTSSGGAIAFINKYSSVKIDPKAKVTFKDYNWNLNK
jgi:hypothetical protein